MSNKDNLSKTSISLMYDVIDILQNNLRFPELAAAVENLNKFDRDELENDICEIADNYISKLIEEKKDESYNDGYQDGFNVCYEEQKKQKEKKEKKGE